MLQYQQEQTNSLYVCITPSFFKYSTYLNKYFPSLTYSDPAVIYCTWKQ